jgi:hypothetical protein
VRFCAVPPTKGLCPPSGPQRLHEISPARYGSRVWVYSGLTTAAVIVEFVARLRPRSAAENGGDLRRDGLKVRQYSGRGAQSPLIVMKRGERVIAAASGAATASL